MEVIFGKSLLLDMACFNSALQNKAPVNGADAAALRAVPPDPRHGAAVAVSDYCTSAHRSQHS